jgi:hypothetical protein
MEKVNEVRVTQDELANLQKDVQDFYVGLLDYSHSLVSAPSGDESQKILDKFKELRCVMETINGLVVDAYGY